MSRARRRTVKGLIVLASVFAFLSVFGIWVERQALNTDDWVGTSGRLIENEQIRTAVGDYIVDQLYENVDIKKELEDILPGDTKDLAGPAAGGLRQVAGDGVEIHSCGTRPGTDINHESAAALAEIGADMSGGTPKGVDEDLLRRVDHVIILGADAQLELPADAAGELERWVTDEPSERGITGMERMRLVRDDIDARVQALVTE